MYVLELFKEEQVRKNAVEEPQVRHHGMDLLREYLSLLPEKRKGFEQYAKSRKA
jgi:hypothetical protein